MRSQDSGTIFFMGSISGWHGVAGGGPYSASKFALEGNITFLPNASMRVQPGLLICFCGLGAVECLAKETQHLGIRVHLLVIGQFRTNILDISKKKAELDPEQGEPCYAAIKADMARIHAATTGAQPGDTAMAAERIVDLAQNMYLPGGKVSQLPLRIPLGSDAVAVMRRKCEATLHSLEAWQSFAQSTDFQNMPAVPSYLR